MIKIKNDKNNLESSYFLASKIFPRISKFCSTCNICCYTYGWLLKKEAERFIKRGYPVAQLNNSLYCIDSFFRNKKRKILFNKIPRCVFYKNKKCDINNKKPLDCRLYPIKIKYAKNSFLVGLSSGCKYVSSLNKKELEKIYISIIKLFKKIPKNILDEYLDMIYKISLISYPKKFWLKKILKIKKYKDHINIVDFSGKNIIIR